MGADRRLSLQKNPKDKEICSNNTRGLIIRNKGINNKSDSGSISQCNVEDPSLRGKKDINKFWCMNNVQGGVFI